VDRPHVGVAYAASRVYDTYVLSSASYNFDTLAKFQIALGTCPSERACPQP